MAPPIEACYTALMSYHAILIIECLVEDYGWDAVIDELMALTATAPYEDLDELDGLLAAAVTVSEGKGQLLVF